MRVDHRSGQPEVKVKILQVVGLIDHHLQVDHIHQGTAESLKATGRGQPEVHAKVLQVVGLLDHHLSVGQGHRKTEENFHVTGNGKPEVGKEQLQVVGLLDHHYPVDHSHQKIKEGLHVVFGSLRLIATKSTGSQQQEMEAKIMEGLIVLHYYHLKTGRQLHPGQTDDNQEVKK
ncbi:hypothetical protein DPMN_126524 [Dreissena polymorpha]|uniref:Uncharacterized protein n=1 Tax=Dreissena polymorpha TaxID=45954 RepID=A0A9D4GXH2_DREPO|nr:hypothetical protein DPMN_126524 [Dreissena polymorpha]